MAKNSSLICYSAFLLLVLLFSLGSDRVMDNRLCGMGPIICIFL